MRPFFLSVHPKGKKKIIKTTKTQEQTRQAKRTNRGRKTESRKAGQKDKNKGKETKRKANTP